MIQLPNRKKQPKKGKKKKKKPATYNTNSNKQINKAKQTIGKKKTKKKNKKKGYMMLVYHNMYNKEYSWVLFLLYHNGKGIFDHTGWGVWYLRTGNFIVPESLLEYKHVAQHRQSEKAANNVNGEWKHFSVYPISTYTWHA